MMPPRALYIEAALSDKAAPMPMLFWYLKSLYRCLNDRDITHPFWGEAIRHVLDSNPATSEFFLKIWVDRIIRTIEEKVKAIDGSKVYTKAFGYEDKVQSMAMHQLNQRDLIQLRWAKNVQEYLKLCLHDADTTNFLHKKVPGTYLCVCMDERFEDFIPLGAYVMVNLSEKEDGISQRIVRPHLEDVATKSGFGILADIHPALATSILYYEYCTDKSKDLVEKFFQNYPVQITISDNPPANVVYEALFSDGSNNPIAEWVRRGLMLFMSSSLQGPKTPVDFYKFMVSSWA